MSRTIRGAKGPGYDYWSKRSNGYMTPGKVSKRGAAKFDRENGKSEIRAETDPYGRKDYDEQLERKHGGHDV